MPIPYCCAVSKIIAWNPKAIHMSGGHFYQKVVFFSISPENISSLLIDEQKLAFLWLERYAYLTGIGNFDKRSVGPSDDIGRR
jgi:hypothetical protein